MQLSIYDFKGNNLPEKLENARKVKELLSELSEYPLNYLKSTLLNDKLVKYNGLIHSYSNGALTAFEFLNTLQFQKAIKLTTRKAIKSI